MNKGKLLELEKVVVFSFIFFFRVNFELVFKFFVVETKINF